MNNKISDANSASLDIVNSEIDLRNIFSMRLTITLLCIFTTLLGLHCLGIGTALAMGSDRFLPRQLLKLFYFDGEYNVSSWFGSALHLLSALVLFTISIITKGTNQRWYWSILALIFMLLSIDESVAIHEWFIPTGRSFIPWLGYAGWLIIALPLLIIIAVPYVFFLAKLPSKTRVLVIFCGLVFIIGAVAFEFLGSQIVQMSSSISIKPWLFRVEITLEESFEMTGLILFLHGTTSYLVALLRKQYT